MSVERYAKVNDAGEEINDDRVVADYIQSIIALLLLEKRIRNGSVTLSEENVKAIQNSIKELCMALGEDFVFMHFGRF